MRDVVLIWPSQPALLNPIGYPPLGLLSIAGYLMCRDIPVRIVNLADVQPDELDDVLDKRIPDASIYGIGFTTPMYREVQHLVSLLRAKHSKSTIVLGGVHASVMPQETYQALKPDHVVIGDGEVPMYLLALNAIPKTQPLITGEQVDIKTTPLPARHLLGEGWVDVSGIHGCDSGKRATTMMTSRGCPYKCAYCCAFELGNRIRWRSPEQVFTEMRLLKEVYGIEHVRFVDDVFTIDRPRLEDICMRLEPLDMTWMSITRADLVTQDTLKRMYYAGCREVAFGVESGHLEQLQRMNKRETVKQNFEAIQMAKDAGLRTKVFILFGFPGETRKTAEATMEFIRKAQPDSCSVSTFVPLPGSPVWSHPERYGVDLISRDFNQFWFYWDKGSDKGWFIRYPNDPEIHALRNEMRKFHQSEEWRS